MELYESIIVSYKVRNGNNTNARHDEANLNDARIHTGELPHILTCCHDSVMYIIFSELNHFVFFINTFMKNKHILTTNKSIWRALL